MTTRSQHSKSSSFVSDLIPLLSSEPATPAIYAMSTVSVISSANLNLTFETLRVSIRADIGQNNLNLKLDSQVHFKIILNAAKSV